MPRLTRFDRWFLVVRLIGLACSITALVRIAMGKS